jgi:hypothetical protein
LPHVPFPLPHPHPFSGYKFLVTTPPPPPPSPPTFIQKRGVSPSPPAWNLFPGGGGGGVAACNKQCIPLSYLSSHRPSSRHACLPAYAYTSTCSVSYCLPSVYLLAACLQVFSRIYCPLQYHNKNVFCYKCSGVHICCFRVFSLDGSTRDHH